MLPTQLTGFPMWSQRAHQTLLHQQEWLSQEASEMLGCASRLLLGEIIYPPSPSKLTLVTGRGS